MRLPRRRYCSLHYEHRQVIPLGDGDTVQLAGGSVRGKDVEDTVGVGIESNIDLRNSRQADPRELKLAEEVP